MEPQDTDKITVCLRVARQPEFKVAVAFTMLFVLPCIENGKVQQLASLLSELKVTCADELNSMSVVDINRISQCLKVTKQTILKSLLEE